MGTTVQLCTFTVAGQDFGVEVRRVQEVLRHQEMTRVTLARRDIRGLINLRGQIVMAIDLRSCLGLPQGPPDAPPMNLVIRTDDGPVSLLVDRISDVIDVDEATAEATPPNLSGPARDFVRRTYPLAGGLLLLLDTDAVLAMIEAPEGA